jgi:hypothetical protein
MIFAILISMNNFQRLFLRCLRIAFKAQIAIFLDNFSTLNANFCRKNQWTYLKVIFVVNRQLLALMTPTTAVTERISALIKLVKRTANVLFSALISTCSTNQIKSTHFLKVTCLALML